MSYAELARRALEGKTLSRSQCYRVLNCPDEELLGLLQAAYQVRAAFFGHQVSLQLLINAKSGLCSQDCSYCSQSCVSTAPIESYPLVGQEKLLEGAQRAARAGATRYCIVASGHSPTEHELEALAQAVRRIKESYELDICCSAGFLSPEGAKRLKQAGVGRINHNLNTSERCYPRICTTHTYRDRVRCLQHARAAGLSLCSGVLFGLGEGDDDVIDVTLALRELEVESIPVNFLHPIEGTPLAGISYLTPQRCLKLLCLVRLLNPSREVRVAGGRELHLRSLQPLALYPANSIFVSGYLTTSGQSPEEARQMIEDMGFQVAVE